MIPTVTRCLLLDSLRRGSEKHTSFQLEGALELKGLQCLLTVTACTLSALEHLEASTFDAFFVVDNNASFKAAELKSLLQSLGSTVPIYDLIFKKAFDEKDVSDEIAVRIGELTESSLRDKREATARLELPSASPKKRPRAPSSCSVVYVSLLSDPLTPEARLDMDLADAFLSPSFDDESFEHKVMRV